MLIEMTLENFKAFANRQTAKLAPITLVFGPNSAGKSSLIQSLLLMKQTISWSESRTSSLITRGDLVDLGSFKSLIYKHDSRRSMTMSLTYSPVWEQKSSPYRYQFLTVDVSNNRRITSTFRAKASLNKREGKRDSSQLTDVSYEILGAQPLKLDLVYSRNSSRKPVYSTGSDRTAFQFKPLDIKDLEKYLTDWYPGKDQPPINNIVRHLMKSIQEVKSFAEQSDAGLSRGFFTAHDILPSIWIDTQRKNTKLYDACRRMTNLIARVVEEMSAEYRRILQNFSYLGPMRVYPPRFYDMTGGLKNSVGIKGQDVPSLIYRDPNKITKDINDWFIQFDIPYKIAVTEIGNEVTGKIIAMTLEDKNKNIRLSPSDVGFGIGQLLPIIVEGLMVSHRVILVEQPEIHLHPKLQAHFGDFMIETAGLKTTSDSVEDSDGVKNVSPRNQWIVETHSEAIMLRLQKRIRQGLPKEHVSVLYVSPRPEGGSKIISLRLDDDGDFIDEWPDGFFEESYKEMFGE